MDVIKRAPVRERRIPLKQRVEQGAKLDCTPGLGRSPPDQKREFSSHRCALVEQPRLAEPGAALDHDHGTGPGPDLAQLPADDREFPLTSAERRPGRSVHFPRVHRGIVWIAGQSGDLVTE
jgi:hypothetical protein